MEVIIRERERRQPRIGGFKEETAYPFFEDGKEKEKTREFPSRVDSDVPYCLISRISPMYILWGFSTS